MRQPHDHEYYGRHTRHEPRKKKRRRGCLTRILMFVLLLALLSYPFLEPYMLQTEVTSLTHADLPDGIRQLRLVYLTDIHAGPFFDEDRVESLVRRVKAVYWWCHMHTEAPLPAAEIMRSMPTDADIDFLYEQYAIRPKETDAPAWGECPVWQEFHSQTPYPYSVD